MAKEHWIQGAIKHPGALHKELGVPQGQKIPAKKLAKAAQAGGKLGQRARLAETLKGMHHKDGYDRHLGNPAHAGHHSGHVGGHGEVDGMKGHKNHTVDGKMEHLGVPHAGTQGKKHHGKHGGMIGQHPYGGTLSGLHSFHKIAHKDHAQKMSEG